MQKDKAPSPDSFTTNFFHFCWRFLKSKVYDLVEKSHQNNWVLPARIATFLTLITNEENDTTPGKFHPISLCNAIYKIISKVIVNRLKPLLPILISPEKIGYVQGRKILDGIILSNEVTHSLKIVKSPGMLLKLDLSKAFDKLN